MQCVVGYNRCLQRSHRNIPGNHWLLAAAYMWSSAVSVPVGGSGRLPVDINAASVHLLMKSEPYVVIWYFVSANVTMWADSSHGSGGLRFTASQPGWRGRGEGCVLLRVCSLTDSAWSQWYSKDPHIQFNHVLQALGDAGLYLYF